MCKLSASEIALIRAAASLAAHAPESMRAGHLALPLERLSRRLAAERLQDQTSSETTDLPRAA